MMPILAVAIGGALGAVARYLLNHSFSIWLGKTFPYGILSANVIGSFFIGIAVVYFANKLPESENLRLFIIVGFLGAFTTFSTFSLDTIQLIQMSEYSKAFFNISLNLILCLSACALGIYIMKTI